MSEELVKRLLEPYTQRQSRRVDAEFAAADRIKELEAKLAKAEQRGYANAMEAERKMHDDCIGELKTKLAKAVGLLEAWVNVAAHCTIEEGVCCCGFDMASHGNPLDHNHMPVDHGAYVARGLVEETNATLAELTGGKDE